MASIDVVELIVFIEELADAEFDADELGPEQLRDVDTIYRSFFER